jgi:phosphoribosylformimino-5-aminoimidazole carboxamide ribotide isomerase
VTPAQFVVYPAIDLRQGQVVRLRQGDPAAATVFSDEPSATGRRWSAEGATWLHVVNLDGALGGGLAGSSVPLNLVRLQEIWEAVHLPIQYGGGIRTMEDIARVLELGAKRAIIGTVAVRRPELVEQAVNEFGPEAVVVALDARDGRVTVDGWQTETQVPVLEAAHAMRSMGILRILFTDVTRDGMLGGPNAEATADLAARSGLKVIASGGVGSLGDVAALARRAPDGVEGVVIGQGLYTGALSLRDALRVVSNLSQDSERC